ncbi:hypothetical protein PIB30_105110, partial [Stylosanthes scabra]|nr:hypothetical protein [Stylosanthes scabra]
ALGIEKSMEKAKEGIGSKGFMKRSEKGGFWPRSRLEFHIFGPRPSLFEAQFDLYGGRTAEAQGTLPQLGSI